MTALRSLALGLSPFVGEPLQWPLAEAGEVLDYTLDVSTALLDAGDYILTAQVSIAPSGPAELTATQLDVAGNLLTVWLSGGQPGRSYSVLLQAVTAAGRAFDWPVELRIDPTPALGLAPAAPASTGYGSAVLWIQVLVDSNSNILLSSAGNQLLVGAQ